MSDLISRQAAIDAIFKVGHEHIMENVLPIGAVLDYSEAIKALPIVDAVEVVRCKDCKHFVDEGFYCTQNIVPMFNHFYCYYGERKEGE